MNAWELIQSRRSTRKYNTKAVEREKLEQIIEAGRYAPSGGNCQATHFIVIQKREVLDRLAELVKQELAKMDAGEGMYVSLAHAIEASKKGAYIFHYNTPALIVTANQNDSGNSISDCACALENMMLMANALDLGSCWINQLRWLNENPALLAYLRGLGMEDSERVYGALAVGYPATEDSLPVRTPLPRKGNPVTWVQ